MAARTADSPSLHLIVQEAEAVLPLDPALCRKMILYLCESWSGRKRAEVLRHFKIRADEMARSRSRLMKELAADPRLMLVLETIRARIYRRMRRPSWFLV
jgi:hypothetical protein